MNKCYYYLLFIVFCCLTIRFVFPVHVSLDVPISPCCVHLFVLVSVIIFLSLNSSGFDFTFVSCLCHCVEYFHLSLGPLLISSPPPVLLIFHISVSLCICRLCCLDRFQFLVLDCNCQHLKWT